MTERTKIVLMGANLMALLLPAAAQNSTAPSQNPMPSQTTVPTRSNQRKPARLNKDHVDGAIAAHHLVEAIGKTEVDHSGGSTRAQH
jgi:hypothetical protein